MAQAGASSSRDSTDRRLTEEQQAVLSEVAGLLFELDGLRTLDPLALYRPLPRLLPFHRARQKERWLIKGNRAGGSYAIIADTLCLALGRCTACGLPLPAGSSACDRCGIPCYTGPLGGAEIWITTAKTQKSLETIRPYVRALLPPRAIREWRYERAKEESELTLWHPREQGKPGVTIRFKSCDQGRRAFESGAIIRGVFDEEPLADGEAPNAIFDETYTRTMTTRGDIVVGFTPLNGLRWREAYEKVYLPWERLQAVHPEITAGEVSPGVHVTTASMEDNPYVPPEEIENLKQRFAHRPLVLAVRLYGKWVETSEESIVDVTGFATWSEPQAEGWAACCIAIDPKYKKAKQRRSAKGKGAEGAIAVARLGRDGKRYLETVLHGDWRPGEQAEKIIRVILANGSPPTWMQNVPGDIMLKEDINARLVAMGHHPVIRLWPETGTPPGREERAAEYELLVNAGAVLLRAGDPGCEEFRRQAGAYTPAYDAAGGLCDAFDAGMAATTLVTRGGGPSLAEVNVRAVDSSRRERENVLGSFGLGPSAGRRRRGGGGLSGVD